MSRPPGANVRVAAVAGKRCRILLSDGNTAEAVIRGRLFQNKGGGVVAGDWVSLSESHGQWTVEDRSPRANEFVRQGLRNERQVLFANVDRVFILASLSQPQTKAASIDRFLIAALSGNIPAELLLTKSDLDPVKHRRQELESLYRSFDLPVHCVSNTTGEGIDEIRSVIAQGTTAVVGNSGVGKSSLLNNLIPGLNQEVREISSWSGKGTHVTTSALLVRYGNEALLMDTPGMKSFTPYGITRENLAGLFPEFQDFAGQCRFRNCLHRVEPDCAVIAAAEQKRIPPSRLRSYWRLLDSVPTSYSKG